MLRKVRTSESSVYRRWPPSRATCSAFRFPPGEIRGLQQAMISGTISGSLTGQKPIKGNPLHVVATFSGSGNAPKLGNVSVSAGETVTITMMGKASRQSYSAGLGLLKTPSGNFQINFSGSGQTTANGVVTGTFRGTALGKSGLLKGASETLTFQIHGNVRTGTFTMTFKIG